MFYKKLIDLQPRRVFGAFLTLAAVVYLIFQLGGGQEQVPQALDAVQLPQLFMSLVAAFAMVLLKATYHVLLLQRLCRHSISWRDTMPAYSVAQIVRYLPGKVWGVIYQVNRLSNKAPMSAVVATNTIQMATTNFLSVGVIVSVLAAALMGVFWPLLGIPISFLAVELIHRTPLFERWVLSVIDSLRRKPQTSGITGVPFRILGTAILSWEWLAYYLIWLLLLGSTQPILEVIILATWYAAASLLAIFAFVVPAGLAIREAIFVEITSLASFSNVELITYAAIMRVILTLAELLSVPVVLVLARARAPV